MTDDERKVRQAEAQKKWIKNLSPDKLEAYRAKQREYQRQYRLKNKDMVKAKKAEKYLRTKDCIIAKVAKWAKENKDKTRAAVRKWGANNRGKINASASIRSKLNRHKCNAKAAKYRSAKINATPLWANEFFIKEAYHLSSLRTKMFGFKWHVDHIVPLKSKLVCGLHCESNLQVIPSVENLLKSNIYWPDMPSLQS